jgi:CRISPR-associated endonuclease/helicase Cas3
MTALSYYRYWGKARPSAETQAAYHLLPYHCLDVAAVGRVFLSRAPGLRRWLADAVGATEEAMLDWVCFWLTLHDLGKFAEAFQSQCPEAVLALRGRAPRASSYGVRHDTLGMVFWRDSLFNRVVDDEWFGPETEAYEDGLRVWMGAVTGHHGQPPDTGAPIAWTHHFNRAEDASAIDGFCAAIRPMFLRQEVARLPMTLSAIEFERNSKALSWWIAGLAVLADWIGSNTGFFPYRADAACPTPLADYWPEAMENAERALRAVGVLPIGKREPTSFAQLFPSIVTPSPLQAWAATVAVLPQPQIHLLEDVTGAGKTEAAVMLAHRLISSGHVDGFYIALPTMATANAMYGRIKTMYELLFDGDPSLVLAHGQRNLVEAFASSVLLPGTAEGDLRQSDQTATTRCTAWLADHQKRALLSPAGVGTIDQALTAVLHSKHQSLRLLGLARKVLVVDEVHACDAYMQALLERLLEFHAMAGGSAILLSATLPQRMKESLLTAYALGRSCALSALTPDSNFPLVTTWQSDAPERIVQQAIDTRDAVRRTVATRYCDNESEVVTAIKAALARGESACWMRNTVADALAAQRIFEDTVSPDKLILFHARFALGDRLDTERRVLDCFGPDSTPCLRAGRLVIATQVAEQSLDADWDFLVTDLAPIDRVIQRAGRLRRHPRDVTGARLSDPAAKDRRGPPCLWVLGPAWSEAPEAAWFKAAFPKAAHVYPDHAQLWRSAKLIGAGQFTMPDDARRLIETVFAEDAEAPPGLQASANAAEGRGYGDSSLAQQHTLKLLEGYVRGAIDWWSEAKTTTRLGEDSTAVLLARWEGNRLRPWIHRDDPRHAWAYSTVRVATRLIARPVEPASLARQVELQRVMDSLPDKGKWSVLLPLEQIDGAFIGAAWAGPQGREPERQQAWAYDDRTGLRVRPAAQAASN